MTLPCRRCVSHAATIEVDPFLGTCAEVCSVCHHRHLIGRGPPPIEVPVTRITNPPPRTGRRYLARERVLALFDATPGEWLTISDLRRQVSAPGQLKKCVDRLFAHGIVTKRKSQRPRVGRGGRNTNEYRRTG